MSYIVHLRKKLRLIGQYATPILMLTAMIASPGSAIAAIANTPYIETFEEYTGGTPLIDGTNGWYGSSSEIIVTNIVRTNYGVISTNLAMIPIDCTLSNRCNSTNTIGIWMQVDANLAFFNGATNPAVDTNASAMFYVDSNGYFVVHNGAPFPTATNSANWVTVKTNAAGQAIDPLSADTSVRINLRQNYETKTWALYTNNVLLADALGFINTTLTNFTGFDLYNGSATSYLDNVNISDWWTVMAVSPTNISRGIWQGQDAGTNLVQVWNSNGTNAMVFSSAVSYTNCGEFTNWLSLTPVTETNYGAAQKSAIWVRMDTTHLTPRTNAYEGAVQVTGAAGTTNSPQVVRVTVSVQGVSLWVSPTNFTKAVTVGQADVFDTMQAANTGGAPRGIISYTMTATSWPTAWLSVSPSSGWVIDDTNNVTLTYATAGLTNPGWYTGRVDVVALGLSTQLVAVRLQVNQQPGVAWNAADKVWTNQVIVGSNLAPATVDVWNASGQPKGQMRYEIYVDENPFNWVSVSPAGGVSTGDHQQATVSYTTAGLAAGEYTARLMLEGWDEATDEPATNGPLFTWLKLTVKLTGSPLLKTDQASLSRTILENYTGTNSFWVWNGGDLPHGGMRYTVTPDVNWVSVSPASGVVTNEPNAISVVWNAGTLPRGIYTGNLEVDAWDANNGTHVTNAPMTIPLTMTIAPRTPQNLELPAVIGALFVGQTVEAYVGLWHRWQNQGLTFSYQWKRAADRNSERQEVLHRQTMSNYVITAADRGQYLRVSVTATDTTDPTLYATADSAWTNAAKVKAVTADWNGDGITDLWFYDQPSRTWRLNFGTASSTAGVWPEVGPEMDAVPGDYDGNGYEDLGVYDRTNGMWYVLLLPSLTVASGSLMGGTVYEAEATPVPADYDGDGATDPAFYWMGYWVVLYSGDLWKNPHLGVVLPFAAEWGEPVMGDWDGNGTTEMGVYADGIWTLRLGEEDLVAQEFGGGGAAVLPAPGDYDGDGATDLGVHDVSANEWRWRSSWTGSNMTASFGPSGGWPVPGYYDHDRKEDFAQVFSSADGDFIVWLVKRTAEPASYPYLYHGQSYQLSTDIWRVSW